MNVKSLFGITVLDKNANEIGKIEDLEFNAESGKIESLTITLKKNIIGDDSTISVDYEEIATIGQYILLDKEIEE